MTIRNLNTIDVIYDDKTYGQIIDPNQWNDNFKKIEENINNNVVSLLSDEGSQLLGSAVLTGLGDDTALTVFAQLSKVVEHILNRYTKPESDALLALVVAESGAATSGLAAHLVDLDNPHVVTKAQVGLGNAEDTADADKPISTAAQTALNLKADITTLNIHKTSADHNGIYYTKTNMQTSGQASVHWGNLTNVPNMADSSWKTAVANRAALPLSGNSINDQRVVLDDGDGKQAMYVCIATSGTVDAQWKKIGDVDWTNDHGNLVGLGDDDHTQYHTDVRGDARYYKKAEVDTLLDDKSGVVIREKEFTATAGQTVFNVSDVGSYVPGSNLMNVYKKNIIGVYEELDRDNFTETSGTVVTLVYPAMANDEYRFRWYENNPEYLNGAYAKKDGTLQTGLNADLLDGQHGSYYAPLANPTFTGTVGGITKSMVGLGNVDNTSDANKPISTAQQAALNAKASLTGAEILTNKTIQKRVDSGNNLASVTPNIDAVDVYQLMSQSQAVIINAPGGTATNHQEVLIRIKNISGSPIGVTWNAIYRAIGTTRPTSIAAGKTVYVKTIYNSTDSKWDIVDVRTEV